MVARPEQIIDNSYSAIVTDPMGTVRWLYGVLGRTMTEDTEARFVAFLGESRQHKFGRHVYSFEQFGTST